MATSLGKTRTNYFAVKDKEAFSELVDNLVTSEGEEVRLIGNKSGEVGFCCNDIIYGLPSKNESESNKNDDELDDDDEIDYDALETEMVHQIQELLEPGHACIMTDISWENLRTVNGTAMIITSDNMEVLNLRDLALDTAKKMLNNPNYEPDMVC